MLVKVFRRPPTNHRNPPGEDSVITSRQVAAVRLLLVVIVFVADLHRHFDIKYFELFCLLNVLFYAELVCDFCPGFDFL